MEANSNHGTILLISWDKILRPKCEGGLGIRKTQDVNAALLVKLGWKIIKEPDNLWTKVVSAKYLTKEDFLDVKKSATASRIWKYVLVHRYLLKRGIRWCLGNGNKIRFWYDNWMEDSPSIEKIPLKQRSTISYDDKVSHFISENKSWKINELKYTMPTNIVDKILNIPIPLSDMQDKFIWKYTGVIFPLKWPRGQTMTNCPAS